MGCVIRHDLKNVLVTLALLTSTTICSTTQTAKYKLAPIVLDSQLSTTHMNELCGVAKKNLDSQLWCCSNEHALTPLILSFSLHNSHEGALWKNRNKSFTPKKKRTNPCPELSNNKVSRTTFFRAGLRFYIFL